MTLEEIIGIYRWRAHKDNLNVIFPKLANDGLQISTVLIIRCQFTRIDHVVCTHHDDDNRRLMDDHILFNPSQKLCRGVSSDASIDYLHFVLFSRLTLIPCIGSFSSHHTHIDNYEKSKHNWQYLYS